jgi:hypothetical protein
MMHLGRIPYLQPEAALRTATFSALSLAAGLVIATTPLAAQKTRASRVADRVGNALVMIGPGPALTLDFDGNFESSLTYDWVVVVDSSLGLIFDGPAGARAAGSPLNPELKIKADIRALAAIAAYEIRVLTFDIWRRHTATLTYSRLQDIKVGEKTGVKRTWNGLAPSEARLHLTSIAYVSKVRYQDGRTVVADPAPVIRAAKAISASITVQDLEPTPKATEQTQATES